MSKENNINWLDYALTISKHDCFKKNNINREGEKRHPIDVYRFEHNLGNWIVDNYCMQRDSVNSIKFNIESEAKRINRFNEISNHNNYITIDDNHRLMSMTSVVHFVNTNLLNDENVVRHLAHIYGDDEPKMNKGSRFDFVSYNTEPKDSSKYADVLYRMCSLDTHNHKPYMESIIGKDNIIKAKEIIHSANNFQRLQELGSTLPSESKTFEFWNRVVLWFSDKPESEIRIIEFLKLAHNVSKYI